MNVILSCRFTLLPVLYCYKNAFLYNHEFVKTKNLWRVLMHLNLCYLCVIIKDEKLLRTLKYSLKKTKNA